MVKILVLCIFVILGSTLAAVETNKRGGHGIFHGLEEQGGKSSWLEESKVDSVKIAKGNTNSLLSNDIIDNSKKSSLYLQPEPRGLDYLLNVPDQNPVLMNFYRRKRDSGHEGTNRRKRQINLLPGNLIPGSRGQAVLYGVPQGSGLPTNGYQQQPIPNNQGIPSGQYGNSDVYPGVNQNNVFQHGFPSGSYPNQNFPQGEKRHVGGYQTYGY